MPDHLTSYSAEAHVRLYGDELPVRGEPSLRELFDEPIVRMLMARDRVSEADVVTALRGDPGDRRA